MQRSPGADPLYFPDGTFANRPQAYDQWIQEIGHGIFHNRSFLPGNRTSTEVTQPGASEEERLRTAG